MRQYPIWVDVTNGAYRSDKSFGARGGFKAEILVGSSSSNSHHLATIEVRQMGDTFRLFVDGICIEAGMFDYKAHAFTPYLTKGKEIPGAVMACTEAKASLEGGLEAVLEPPAPKTPPPLTWKGVSIEQKPIDPEGTQT